MTVDPETIVRHAIQHVRASVNRDTEATNAIGILALAIVAIRRANRKEGK